MSEPVEVKKRRLRVGLRNSRTEAGLTQKQAADKLYWSISKIVRIEQGTVPVAPTDVRAMLHTYGVVDEAVVADMVELAKGTRESKGWSIFGDVLSAESVELFGNEPVAKVIYKYEPSVVPGLLQTYDYAEGLLRALGNSDEDVQRRLEVRTQRQLLLESPQRPTLNFILGETSLALPVSGRNTMIEQLSHLLELSERDDINLWLLPFSVGPHRAMGSAFTVLQFDDPQLADLLYLENAERESVSRDEEGDVRRYLDLFVDLQRMADESGTFEEHVRRVRAERLVAANGEG
jgi:transcriptional regulator with XRE-family HTH domain